MQVIDVSTGIAFGIVFLYLGFNMTFRRKIVGSLLASNKIFWSKMGRDVPEKASTSATRIMIPLMGAAFMLVGVASLYKVAAWLISLIQAS